MSEELTFLASIPDVSEAAKVTTFRCVYRGVEVSVLLLDRGHDARQDRYSVASFATENGLNNQGGDGADWRLQGPAATKEAALALIDWSRFDVRIRDQNVYWSKPSRLPGQTEETRAVQHGIREEVPDPMIPGGTIIQVRDLDSGNPSAFRGNAQQFEEAFEIRPPG